MRKMRISSENVAYEDYFVRATDTDMFYDATIPFYFSAIQEMGGEHASKLGIAIDDLQREKGWTWVITRTRALFYGSSSWRDTLNLETWPQEPYRLHCPRVVNGYCNGSKIFEAMTLWAVIDMNRKRPVRPQEVMGSIQPAPADKYFVNPDIGKIIKYDDAEKLKEYMIYRPTPAYYDIDYNKHVNNVVYLRWITEAMDEDILKTYRPSMLDVQWEHQTFSNDKIYGQTALTAETDDKLSFVHRLMKEEYGKSDTVLFEAYSEWVRK